MDTNTDFYLRLIYWSGKVENFKITIDTDTFLDMWNATRPKVEKIEPITRDTYYENIVGKTVLTYPVSKIYTSCVDKAAVYECYEFKRKLFY